jgi:hypothetical protein
MRVGKKEGKVFRYGDEPMAELTLEALARRVEALERALHLKPAPADKNARRAVVGMFAGSEFMRAVDEAGRQIRVAERAEAREGPPAE